MSDEVIPLINTFYYSKSLLATEECRAQALIKVLMKALRENFRNNSGEGLPPNEAP